jgi:hypothetical protein
MARKPACQPQLRCLYDAAYMINTMPKLTKIDMKTSIHHRPKVNRAHPQPHGAQTKASIFCSSARSYLALNATHDNGDQAHGQRPPEHTTHQVIDGGSEQTLKADISNDVPDGQQCKDDDV